MNLDEWLHTFYELVEAGGTTDIGDNDIPVFVTFEDVRKGICEAVLKEKTLTTVIVKNVEHYDEIARPEDPERIVTMSQSVNLQGFVPEGEYRIVPKETK